MPALLIIKKLDNPVPPSGGRWLRGEVVAVFDPAAPRGSGEEVAAGAFVHFTVTDKTVQEMQQYLQDYTRAFQFTLINPGPPRRYECNNTWANAAGVGHWTTEAVDEIKARWEEDHPAANITTIGFPNSGPNGLGNIWDFSGEFSVGEGQEFIDTVTDAGLGILDKRRVWYITEAGMQNIEAAGGSQSGTAAQLGGILRDARLD